jgi:drug/metabolite transporter (DMT)-like permease
MAKLVVILLLGLVFEATGVVFLSRGLKAIAQARLTGPVPIIRLIGAGATNKSILLGVLLEAVFFGSLIYLMSQADISFVWPLTALGFVLTTLAAKFILREEISALRWAGVILIVAGAALITWSEKSKSKPSRPEIISHRPQPL